jgi:hypothetical protein
VLFRVKCLSVLQAAQLDNELCRIRLDEKSALPPLNSVVIQAEGLSRGDCERFDRFFWEVISDSTNGWATLLNTPADIGPYGGREKVFWWKGGTGELALHPSARVQGQVAWGRPGVFISRTRSLRAALSCGEIHAQTGVAAVPLDETWLPAIWAFSQSKEFRDQVRSLNKKIIVPSATITQVPFDLSHWQKISGELYPEGLPDPHSDDPTQGLFRGDIPSSTDPLQVAVARLLGYRWTDQLGGAIDQQSDEDGIVTLAPLVSQDGIAGRLRTLLQAAYESPAPVRPKGAPEPKEPRTWDEAVIPNLLERAGSKGLSFEEWLRDKFFEGHCKLFHQRPFIWHIWDGRKDGFHAYINNHKLDKKNLERLTHVYLGEWIERQKAAVDSGDRTADARLIAAQELQRKLELIRTGEPPFDIFVRWKSLAEQPMGWEPDLNDGVRMNIRPFVKAGVLRGKVNVNWNKDRGKDPKPNVSGTVERHNDLHFTLAQKLEAREQAATQRRKPS